VAKEDVPGTKTNTPVETPQSISVITRNQMVHSAPPMSALTAGANSEVLYSRRQNAGRRR
jgi:hypothetical protein